MEKMLRIALTTGEPAGIGPEVCLLALSEAHLRWPNVSFSLLGDLDLLSERARDLKLSLSGPSQFFDLHHVALATPVKPGILSIGNVDYVRNLLDASIDGAMSGYFDAVCTAPLHKSIIAEKYRDFVGHTEYFASRTNSSDVVMMLLGLGSVPIRVALATTHVPLAAVPSRISFDSLVSKLKIIHHYLKEYFGLAHPKIAVAGLNPHAGEDGKLGREEIDFIIPAIESARCFSIDATGPFSADTLFLPRRLATIDCVLAMYHDQGLPVLKHMTFGKGVNVTLGLPIIRTSADHGTALELAGKGLAEADSMIAAIDAAVTIAKRRCFSN